MNKVRRWLRGFLGIQEYNPNRFVQVLPYRDMLIGLDGHGDLWHAQMGYADTDFTITKWITNPLEGYRGY